MSALAGCAGRRQDQDYCERQCLDLLAALKDYGSGAPSTEKLDGAAFGHRPHVALADRFSNAAPIISHGLLVVCDARLDNRQELIRFLGGGLPSDVSNEALIAAGWRRAAQDFVQRLLGDYAIAIYDPGDDTLVLTRDITGQRSLFYSRLEGRRLFASMPAALAGLPGGFRDFETHQCVRHLYGLPPARELSFFQGIQRVPPGAIVTLRNDGETIRQGWHLPPRRASGDMASAIDEYRAMLDEAVRCRLPEGGATVASQLSSGFDSSAVTTTAARLVGSDNVVAFTAAPMLAAQAPAPRGRIADESEIAARTAAYAGIRHRVVRDADPLSHHLHDQARFYQDPSRNLVNAGWLKAIEEAARAEGTTQLLCADMGNMSLNVGGLYVLADIVFGESPLTWFREARQVVRRNPVRWRGALYNSFSPLLSSATRHSLTRLFLKEPDQLALSFARPEWRSSIESSELDLARPSSDSAADRWRYLQDIDYGAIRKGGLAQTGVVSVDPMADRRLLELAFTWPRHFLIDKGIVRPLAKAALADRVPREVLDLPVRGLQSADFHARLSRHSVGELVDEIASSHAATEFIDISRLRALVESWPREGERFSPTTYAILASHLPQTLALGIFLKRFETLASAPVHSHASGNA